MDKFFKIIKNPTQNQELYQKIIYSLCNLNDYPSYYQEAPFIGEDKKERIEEKILSWKKYEPFFPKEIIFINQDKETFTVEQKEQLKEIFKEVIYISLLNNILFISFSADKKAEENIELIKIENDKVFIDYSYGRVWVDQRKDIKCQYCPRKLLTPKEAVEIWPNCCIHCQDKTLKELDWAEFIETKESGWYKPTYRDLEIKEATDKVEYYLKKKVIWFDYYSCGSRCCSCKYKDRKIIEKLGYYSDSFDMDCGIHLTGILNELEESEKAIREKWGTEKAKKYEEKWGYKPQYFNPDEPEPIKCADCQKHLIYNGDIDYFWVDELKENKYLCSDCYWKRLNKNDLVIIADYQRYHNWDKKLIPETLEEWNKRKEGN